MTELSKEERTGDALKNLTKILDVKKEDITLSVDPNETWTGAAPNVRITLTNAAAASYTSQPSARSVPRVTGLPRALDITPVLAELTDSEKRLPSVRTTGESANKTEKVEEVHFHLGDTSGKAIETLAGLNESEIDSARSRVAGRKASLAAQGAVSR